MFNVDNFIPACILLILFFYTTVLPLFAKKNSGKIQLFSPLSIIGLVVFYYVIYPCLRGDFQEYGIDATSSVPYLLWGAVLFYLSLILGFQLKIKNRYFRRWNVSLDGMDIKKVAAFLFLVGFVGFFLFNSFSLSIVRVQEASDEIRDLSEGQSESYLTSLISFFPLAACLMSTQKGNKKWVIAMLILSVIVYLIAGFRNRLVILLLCFAMFYHLFPAMRSIKWRLWIPVGLFFYFSLGVIELTRSYGNGLDVEKLESLESGQFLTESGESRGVFVFSALAMDRFNETKGYIFLEPLKTAIFMPIPRALFPWKPDAQYLIDAQRKVRIDPSVGGAMLNFVEGFIAFGWVGIFVYGFIMGIVSRIFWSNYLHNNKRIEATLLLCIFTASTYMIISRGYLASNFITIMFYVVIPFWIIMLLRRIPYFRLVKK